jgi:hypothetical protein
MNKTQLGQYAVLFASSSVFAPFSSSIITSTFNVGLMDISG